jgi:uncharacterized membrane protein YphA (DoxX/SURF4 family)
MNNWFSPGRICYGLCIVILGIAHFVYEGFRPLVLSIPPEATRPVNFLVHLTGIILTLSGCLLIVNLKTWWVSLLLGWLFLLFFLIGHVPMRLTHHVGILGAWTEALKALGLCGGAFMINRVVPEPDHPAWLKTLHLATCAGRHFFAVMLFIYGIDHFLYAGFVHTLVPGWIPYPLFWNYFSGVALLSAAVSIATGWWLRLSGTLLACMLFSWLLILHIPKMLATTNDNGIQLMSGITCLAFAGMALVVRARVGQAQADVNSTVGATLLG